MSETRFPSIAEKLPQMRVLAAEARQAALHASTSELRQAYEEIARSWEQLFKEIEATEPFGMASGKDMNVNPAAGYENAAAACDSQERG